MCRAWRRCAWTPLPSTSMSTLTYDRLCSEAAGLGVTVHRTRLRGAHGHWDHRTRTIWIDCTYSEAWCAPTLAHELEHVRRGDSGPQRLGVERLIDEHVARRFIDPGRYARAESLVGPDPDLIADELDLPPWVVEAWQRWARRGARIGLQSTT